jgi:uncharacterized membrane protein YhhN
MRNWTKTLAAVFALSGAFLVAFAVTSGELLGDRPIWIAVGTALGVLGGVMCGC